MWQTLTSKENTEVREVIRRIALLNALRYEGKARVQPVLGRLLAERPNLKSKIKDVSPLVVEVVQEVNKLPQHEQRKIAEGEWPGALIREKAEEKRELPPLTNVEKYERVVTRFSPNPN